jgi:DNA-binding NarL/FixJ family response regulator
LVRPGVVIADDQRIVREGLQTVLALGIRVVTVAEDGGAAVAAANEHDADVVLMDLRMPRIDGVGATRRLSSEPPRVGVLVLTTDAEDQDVFPALRAGARGYLTKDAGADEILAAIGALHRGGTHLDPTVQARLVAAVVQAARSGEERPRGAGQHLPDDLALNRGGSRASSVWWDDIGRAAGQPGCCPSSRDAGHGNALSDDRRWWSR